MQAQINLARYPQETAGILQRDKVRQLAKKLESSKLTAKHKKQVSHEPQAAKVNLMRHQCTELPNNKFQRKQRKFKPRQSNSRNQQEHQQYE